MASCAQTDIHPGDLVAGRYRVSAIVDRSKGLLLDGYHTALNQRVTIRVISPSLTSPKGVDQFRREAAAASQLESEHAARILDFGKLSDGSLYWVRDHIAGVPLTERLRGRGALPLSEAVLLCLQLCEAVQEAHSLGILLRDLAPSNVLLSERRNGTPMAKLTDLGTCKVIERGTGDDEVSCTKLFGLSASASPEVVRQERVLDPRADVWSLGCVFYELITGQPPFQGEDVVLMQAIAHDDPAPPSQLRSNLPGALDGITATALAKDRRFRLSSPYALAAALRPFATAHGEILIDQIARLAGDYSPNAAPPGRGSGDEQAMAMVRSVGPSEPAAPRDVEVPRPPRVPSLPDLQLPAAAADDGSSTACSAPPRPTTPPPQSLTAPALGLPPLGPVDPRFGDPQLDDDHPWHHPPPRRSRLRALPLREVARGAVLAMPLCILLFVFVLASPEPGPPAETVPLTRHGAAVDLTPEPAKPASQDGQPPQDEPGDQAEETAAEPPPAEASDFDDLPQGAATPPPDRARTPGATKRKQTGKKKARPRRSNERAGSQFLGGLGKGDPPKKKRRTRRRSKKRRQRVTVRF
ncbi:MAG: protein kinase [Deltaproteobacteria bacterium]|nr:protein kinase [Deltaproteobacteria bacterium]